MALIKWTPVGNNLFDDVDHLFNDHWLPVVSRDERFTPALDITEDKDNLIIETPLVGIDPEKVNIEVEDNVLTISGESEQKREIDDKHFYRREIRHGSFYRSVALPKAVKADAAEATYDNGILKITLPKSEDAKSRIISVKAKKA